MQADYNRESDEEATRGSAAESGLGETDRTETLPRRDRLAGYFGDIGAVRAQNLTSDADERAEATSTEMPGPVIYRPGANLHCQLAAVGGKAARIEIIEQMDRIADVDMMIALNIRCGGFLR